MSRKIEAIRNIVNGRTSRKQGNRREDYGYRDIKSHVGRRGENISKSDHYDIRILSIRLVESGTYNPEFIRPYVVSPSEMAIDELSERFLMNEGDLTHNHIAGVTGEFMTYDGQVTREDLVDIDNGWEERRFHFIIELEEPHRSFKHIKDEFDISLGDGAMYTTIIMGYTDRLDYSHGEYGNDARIPGDLRFYITDVQSIKKSNLAIALDQQLIQIDHRGRKNQRTIQHPYDVIRNGVNNHSREHTKVMTDYRNGGLIPSSRDMVAPSTYLATLLNTVGNDVISRSERDDFRHGRRLNNIVSSNSYNRLNETRTSQGTTSFMGVLRNNTNLIRSKYFEWDDLMHLFKDIDDVTEIHSTGRLQSHRVSRHGETEQWSNTVNGGLNAVIATMFKQILPMVAVSSMIYACRIDVTNMLTRDEIAESRNNWYGWCKCFVSDVVWMIDMPRGLEESYIRKMEESIIDMIMRDVTKDNAIQIGVTVDLDWRFDSTYDVLVDSDDEGVMFSSSSFSNSLTSPVITRSRDDVLTTYEAMSTVINKVLAKVR